VVWFIVCDGILLIARRLTPSILSYTWCWLDWAEMRNGEPVIFASQEHIDCIQQTVVTKLPLLQARGGVVCTKCDDAPA
jgi:hypothetical protein